MPDDLTASPNISATRRSSNADNNRLAPRLPQRDLSPFDLDQRLDQALRAGPSPAVPSNFVAQVASRLPSSLPATLPTSIARTSQTLYAQRAMMLCLLVLLFTLLVTAPHLATGSSRAVAFQWTISAEIAVIAVVLGQARSPWQLSL